jgi:hypothetical protein
LKHKLGQPHHVDGHQDHIHISVNPPAARKHSDRTP